MNKNKFDDMKCFKCNITLNSDTGGVKYYLDRQVVSVAILLHFPEFLTFNDLE